VDGFLVICLSVDVEMEGSDRKFALLITDHRYELLDWNISAACPLPTSIYGTTLKSPRLLDTVRHGTNAANYGLASVTLPQSSHMNVEPARANPQRYARHHQESTIYVLCFFQPLFWSLNRYQMSICRVALRPKRVLYWSCIHYLLRETLL
jgi:hypothetical protein